MPKERTNLKEIAGIFSLVLAAIGLADSTYLTIEHYANKIPPCSVAAFNDCGTVLRSEYSTIGNVPVALLGAVHYSVLLTLLVIAFFTGKTLFKRLVFLSTAAGFVASLYFMFLQVFIIKAFCLYCMVSAFISFSLYFLVRYVFNDEYKELIPIKIKVLYQIIGKPLFFILDPEWVHDNAMKFGSFFGNVPLIRTITGLIFRYENPRLMQKVGGITFENPIGLAAGYDYTASFPKILPSIGFGFETIGTITNQPCEGNEKPRLGRLIKSKSLMVNKGFRNPGADTIIKKLEGQSFEFPVGISIGITNSSDITNEKQAIEDIISAFKKFKKSKVKHSYYELNISCPNLKTKVSFYEPVALKKLLTAVEKLNIKKPIFIKMPIEKKDEEVKSMLKVIVSFPITGIIFGNLQKDRKNKMFVKEEVEKWGKGNFSGKPTQKRSDDLIKLAYKQVGKKLIIIGCGGVFSGEDAYRKIKNGATLVQMITGMIFEGPQVIGQINRDLVKLLKKDGFSEISDAIGSDTN